MKTIFATLLSVGFIACNGFVGEVDIAKPSGPPLKIVNADYVVLRGVETAPAPGTIAAALGQQTLYFKPAKRILDLRQLDPRTAKLEDGPENTTVISLRTTPEGEKALATWTSANVGNQLGVFLDGRLIDAPRIRSKIDTMIVLDGSFTKAQAEEVLGRLRHGGAAV